MLSSILASRSAVVRAVLLCIALNGLAQAEAFNATPGAAPLHSRETGPSIGGQTTPAPAGGWSSSDDRLLNATINVQGGWQNIEFANRFDEEIATGIAHSGGHSWRLSNWYHSLYVNPLLSPQFASVGETGAVNHDGAGSTTQVAQSHHVSYEFWFRSAAPDDAHPDPGSAVSTTLSDAPGNRLTYLGIFDERPGPGGPTGNGCPTTNGCFHVDVAEAISGNDSGNDGDASYADHYSAPLTRGVWYRALIDATFVDGPGPVTTDPALCPAATTCHTGNDQVHYQVFDGNGHVVFDSGVIGSWEAAYYDGRYGNAVGTVSAADYVGFRVSANADGVVPPSSSINTVGNRPHGVYFDDLKVVPDAGSGFSTSFDFDRYVATTGSDNTACNVAATPCKTITYAIGQANAYDTIHVAAGTYAENSGAGQNLVINKPVAIEGAQAGIDARTRNVGAALETILVPAVVDTGLSLDSVQSSAVVTIGSDGVSLDGLIVDGDNPNLTSPSVGGAINLNGANPDAASGIFATGNGITLQNLVLRNVGGSGVFGYMNSGSGGDNTIQFNRFSNITNPSNLGLGIYAGFNFYAQIRDNLMDQVRVGMQIENNSAANPGTQAPAVLRNEIHATRTALFDNLFYGSASTYTFSGNSLIAAANAAQAGQWNGMQIESMGDAQTVVIQNNQIDATALGNNRIRVGYLINNWTSSQSAATAIDGGSVANVDAGVLVTDASNYTGPVTGARVQNIAFSNVTLGAVYVEDNKEVAGAPAVTIGAGNSYAGVNYRLALAGAAPAVSFNGVSGADSVLVRAGGNYLFNKLDSSGPCSSALCSTSNASINTAIAAANPGATVYLEQGSFDEMPSIGAGKTGLRLTAADQTHQPTLTRLSGGPNQPVLLVNGVKNVMLDHLHIAVDKKFAAEGILANGFIDGLNIHDNLIVQSASSTSGVASYKYTNGISINIDPQHNSLGLSQSDGANATIQNNTIGGSAGPNTTTFRAGIAMDRGVGTITGNTSAGLNHDAIVRFANTVVGGPTAVLIDGNTFNGGGLEFDAPNAVVTPITISNNTITAAVGSAALSQTQQQLEADISVLRLIDNSQNAAVTVSNNQLLGYARGYRGATLQNFPATTFSGNTFTPLAGANDFVSLVISNKEINANNPPQAPYPMSFTALRNSFNGSGVTGAGRAVELIDDNDLNGSAAFGALLFGSSQASDANVFDAGNGRYFNLIDQHCDTNLLAVGSWPGGVGPQCSFLDYNDVNAPGGLVNTQVRPFRANVRAANNLYAGAFPAAMGATQRAALFGQTFDVNDDSALGLVDYGLGAGVQLALDGPIANVQAGVPAVFSGEVANAGPTPGENVRVHLVLSSDRAGGIQAGDITAQYFDSGSNSYLSLPLSVSGTTLVADFGPPGGFAIPQGYDVTTALRFTFNYANGSSGSSYTAAGSVVGVTTQTVYAVDVHHTNVVQTAAHVALTLAGPASAVAATPAAYSARILNAGGAVAENVLVHFAIGRNGGIGANDLTVQYFDGNGYQPIGLTPCNGNTQLCGTFGPPAGFAAGVGYDATTPLQLNFVKSGLFTVQATVDGMSSSNYASAALAVNVAAGAAVQLAAFGPTSFNGIAGAALNTTPAVIATDAGGNPVPGVAVTFAAGANSGSVSGASQSTDANGIATLGGWTLSPAATASDTVSASASGLPGSPVGFVANGAAQYDLGVTITPSRRYVQYGHTLDYVVVISNSGPSDASAVSVQNTLTSGITATAPSWFCVGSQGASCSSGSGNFADAGVAIPAGGSVTYVLSTSVLNAANLPTDQIVDSVSINASHDTNAANNSATAATVQGVIFRDGLESGGDGAQNGAALNLAASLDGAAALALSLPAAGQDAAMPATWFVARDARGRETLRGELSQVGAGGLRLRLVGSDADAQQTAGAWHSLPEGMTQLALGLAVGKAGQATQAMLVGGSVDLAAVLPAWASLPLALYQAK